MIIVRRLETQINTHLHPLRLDAVAVVTLLEVVRVLLLLLALDLTRLHVLEGAVVDFRRRLGVHLAPVHAQRLREVELQDELVHPFTVPVAHVPEKNKVVRKM